MLKLLSEEEFASTFGNSMNDVSETAIPVIDIWEYVSLLVNNNLLPKYVFDNFLVESVYRNDTATFDHILLPTQKQNVYLVIVVDIINKTIFGHSSLNLEEKYNLSN